MSEEEKNVLVMEATKDGKTLRVVYHDQISASDKNNII